MYLGDDVTDEDAFGALCPGDVAVKIGEGETVARYRVADVPGAVALLDRLARPARLSCGRVAGRPSTSDDGHRAFRGRHPAVAHPDRHAAVRRRPAHSRGIVPAPLRQ